jgi:hypothetical protein
VNSTSTVLWEPGRATAPATRRARSDRRVPSPGGHAALRPVALGVHWAAKVAGVSIPSAECGRRWL